MSGDVLKPCRACGASCRVERFEPNEMLIDGATLWMCSNHPYLGGDCPDANAYLYEDAWNTRPATGEGLEDDLSRVLNAAEYGANMMVANLVDGWQNVDKSVRRIRAALKDSSHG